MQPDHLVSNVCRRFDLGHVLDWRLLEGGEDNLNVRVMTDSGRAFVVRHYNEATVSRVRYELDLIEYLAGPALSNAAAAPVSEKPKLHIDTRARGLRVRILDRTPSFAGYIGTAHRLRFDCRQDASSHRRSTEPDRTPAFAQESIQASRCGARQVPDDRGLGKISESGEGVSRGARLVVRPVPSAPVW